MKAKRESKTDSGQRAAASADIDPAQKRAAFVDRRASAVAQRRLMETIERSRQATARKSFGEEVGASPSMAAQRKRIQNMFGEGAHWNAGVEEPQKKAATTGVLQCKKTTQPAHLDLINQFATGGHTLPDSVLSGKVTDPEKGDAIWAHLNKNYDDNKDNGQRYWDSLTGAISQYKDPSTKGSVVSDNTIKRSGYDTKFAANYANTSELIAGENYQVSTQGYDPDTSTAPTVPTGAYKGNYSNEIDLAGGKIKAAWNFGADIDRDTGAVTHYYDKALEAKKGLSNSEILWQQSKLAAKKHYHGQIDESTKVSQALKNLSKIQRDTVINDETKETVYMAYPDGQVWTDADIEWRPGQEEFLAILGTPNAKSSAFLLKDHLDELEKTIEKITTTSAGGIDIDFIPI